MIWSARLQIWERKMHRTGRMVLVMRSNHLDLSPRLYFTMKVILVHKHNLSILFLMRLLWNLLYCDSLSDEITQKLAVVLMLIIAFKFQEYGRQGWRITLLFFIVQKDVVLRRCHYSADESLISQIPNPQIVLPSVQIEKKRKESCSYWLNLIAIFW